MNEMSQEQESRVSDLEGSFRSLMIAVAVTGVALQILVLSGARFFSARFAQTFSELGVQLPAITRFALGYGLSLTFLALSIAALAATCLGRGRMRIFAFIAAALLPFLHAGAVVVALYLPLFQMVETVGGGS